MYGLGPGSGWGLGRERYEGKRWGWGSFRDGKWPFLFFTMDSYTPFIVIAYLVNAGCTHTHTPKVNPEQMGVWEGLPFAVLGVSILYRVPLQSNSLLGCV